MTRTHRRLTIASATSTAAPVPQRRAGAIYCRISDDKAGDEIGVARQEKECRDNCVRMGITVASEHVFIDNSKSAWKRDRNRPGWDAMLEAGRRGEIDFIVAYHPDRLMRQPKDLEELLVVATDNHINLVGSANGRDLSNPDDVFILRIEVAHACRSSDDTSRRVRNALRTKALEGKAHGGRRPFGYTRDNEILPAEAEIVRDIVRKLLRGESVNSIVDDLNTRSVPTVTGKTWHQSTIRAITGSARIAGYRMHKGEIVAEGAWPAIVTANEWEDLQRMAEVRAAVWADNMTRAHPYVLRGVMRCSLCGSPMTGSSIGRYPTYKCRAERTRDGGCNGIRITARPVEELVEKLVLDMLPKLDFRGRARTAEVPEAVRIEIAAAEDQLKELAGMWGAKDITTTEYRAAREPIKVRLAGLRQVSPVRPVRALQGLSPQGVVDSWAALSPVRKNAIYRMLFDSIVIGPATKPYRVFKRDRVAVNWAED